MIPIKLNNILDSLEFENDGLILIRKTDIQDDFIDIVLSVRLGHNDKKELWTIRVKNYKEYSFTSKVFYDIILHKEHCLLLSYNGYSAEIFVNEKIDNKKDLFEKLYLAHRKVCKDWIPFDKFIPHGFDNLGHFELDYGSFARGPIEILKVYFDTLKKYYNKVNIVGKYGRRVHIPESGFETDKTIYRILVLGDSFIIGEDFEFNQIVND
jgi:hypothetical protein